MTNPWRIIACALFLAYGGLWLLLVYGGRHLTQRERDAALLGIMAVGVVALCRSPCPCWRCLCRG